MTDPTRPQRLEAACEALPLVAILRGLRPEEAVEIAQALFDAGFRLIEIPLNSPEPFDSIAAVRKALPAEALVGAGTVTTLADVARLDEIGADLVVMPHADTAVIAAAKVAGMICIPGIATPTEAYAALNAGADALKVFPAELVGPAAVKAIRTILPAGTRLFPVGGIAPDTMGPFRSAGVAGFGLGSALYSPGDTVEAVSDKAARFVIAWQEG
ncbi:2-dehydro-3-deoxy-6-phosphogalactonate aldolase [Salipiger bermudensis]|uniref:Keto-hydroxyglutarate-aldolase/keto-deoxy-phosphogluconate aldolase n=1 Tax=Salipiger bermudensis (strain DSM 26914 / JCM 13377 / KCTC 12554 / HTCC2601) TaxID=314265 RepID=Q0FLF8_SALBH|nr:2-dehydro-3-deoxy-6-phosphogalactonate aldolase [Salipiger bermudensis]EAU45016.1 keto-hydroxyglutarate-aldolase/keto-deoxy-phosphogluconate aldolase [Salipiger bermudensis HTCC2601]